MVTTDKRLASDASTPWQFELVDTLEGGNLETGGTSIGYVQRVVRGAAG